MLALESTTAPLFMAPLASTGIIASSVLAHCSRYTNIDWLPPTVTIRALRFWRPMFCQHELGSNTGGEGWIRTNDFTDLQSVALGHSATSPLLGSGPWNRTRLQGLTVLRLHRVCLTGIILALPAGFEPAYSP